MLCAEREIRISPAVHQRADGKVRIEFAAEQARTRLVDLFQRAPCRVLFPDVDVGEPAHAVLLTTSGGLTGGDRIDVEFVVGAGARATLTTQAAEKIYRAVHDGGDASIDVRVEVGANAWAEWLAQETIVFDAARMRRVFHADVASGGRLLAVESIVLGRGAMSETFRHGFVHDAWHIRRDGRLIFADALRLDGDIQALRSAPFGFGDARAFGTVIYVGDDASALRDRLREFLQPHAGVAQVTTRDGMLLVRLLAQDPVALRAAVMAAAGCVRSLSANLPPRLPQVWYC